MVQIPLLQGVLQPRLDTGLRHDPAREHDPFCSDDVLPTGRRAPNCREPTTGFGPEVTRLSPLVSGGVVLVTAPLASPPSVGARGAPVFCRRARAARIRPRTVAVGPFALPRDVPRVTAFSHWTVSLASRRRTPRIPLRAVPPATMVIVRDGSPQTADGESATVPLGVPRRGLTTVPWRRSVRTANMLFCRLHPPLTKREVVA